MSTNYSPGIYQDRDGDIIKVDRDGTQAIIGTGHDGIPYVDLTFAEKIADLPNFGRPTPTVTVEPVVADGIYRERGGDTVLVRDGVVVEILDTDDGCATDNPDHLAATKISNFLDGAVRLVPQGFPETLPDGFYTDAEGDRIQVKDGMARYIDPRGAVDWCPLSEDYPSYASYASYTPLVEEGAAE